MIFKTPEQNGKAQTLHLLQRNQPLHQFRVILLLNPAPACCTRPPPTNHSSTRILGLIPRYFSLTFSANSRNSLDSLWLAFICSCASCREFSVVRIGTRASSSVATSRA